MHFLMIPLLAMALHLHSLEQQNIVLPMGGSGFWIFTKGVPKQAYCLQVARGSYQYEDPASRS